MSERREWFHVSNRDIVDDWTTERRPPITRGAQEPLTPRLCVSGTAAQALAAVWWTVGRDVGVYVTEPRRTVPAVRVWDHIITGERWVIPVPPVRLRLAEVIPWSAIAAAQAGLEPTRTRCPARRVLLAGERFARMASLVRDQAPSLRVAWVEEFAAEVVSILSRRHESSADCIC